MPVSAPPKSRTAPRERTLAMPAVFHQRTRGPDGALAFVQSYGERGEAVVLDPQEEARLDHLGALAKVGATAEDVEQEVANRIAVYREARGTLPEGL
jgi:hypothetical protein